MARLKNRDHFIPGEFQILLPEAGMREPVSGSFREVVDFFAKLVLKNPGLAQKNNWPTDRASQENFVDEREAARMIAHGWFDFVEIEAAPFSVNPQKKTSLWRSVAGKVSGSTALTDWLGQGGKPVEKELAEKRASICATCPKNDGGDWKSYFSTPVANQIRGLLGVKHDMELSTSYDAQLTVCSACDCNLQLKVWSPADIIAPHTSEAVWNKLDKRCWLFSETGRTPA